MKLLFTTMALLFFVIKAFSQQFSNITFNKLPQNNQLYPRDESGIGQVIIEGLAHQDHFNRSYICITASRENKVFRYQRKQLYYHNKEALFTFQFAIPAELANYHFKIYVGKGNDSTLVVERNNIVAGDVYVVSGQSNAWAWYWHEDAYRGAFARTFGVYTNNNNYDDYNPADTSWSISNTICPVGYWPSILQKNIIEKYHIPVCVINGASGGSGIGYNAERNEANHEALNTSYGRLLYRIKKAGVKDKIKAFMYRQGEAEAGPDEATPLTWAPLMHKLMRNWQNEFPNVQKWYIFQNNLLNDHNYNQGKLRNDQRTLGDFFPKIVPVSTVGTSGYDGVHYNDSGYGQTGSEISKIIEKDFYNAPYSGQVYSPNVQKVFYSTPEKNEVTILFEPEQEMYARADTILYKANGSKLVHTMKSNFFLDKSNNLVTKATASGNKVILTLSEPSNATKLNYLPSVNNQAPNSNTFDGPFLKNKYGMRALSFHEVEIENYSTTNKNEPLILPNITFNKSASSLSTLNFSWESIDVATEYIVERKNIIDNDFQEIKRLQSKITYFEESNLPENQAFTYRIKYKTKTDDYSQYALITIKTQDRLALPNVNVQEAYFDAVVLKWEQVPHATHYLLERKNEKESYVFLEKLNATTLIFTEKKLQSGKQYNYRIKAISEISESFYKDIVAITPNLLAKPIVKIEDFSDVQCKLSWKSSIEKDVQGIILTKEDAFGNVQTFMLPASQTSFEDQQLKENTSYFYKIKFYSKLSESEFTEIRVITKTKLLPSIMSATLVQYGIFLSWNRVANAQRYVLELKNEQGIFEYYKTLDSLTLSTLVLSLKTNSTYEFRINAEALGFVSSNKTTFIQKTPAPLRKVSLQLKAVDNTNIQMLCTDTAQQKDLLGIVLEKKNKSGQFEEVQFVSESHFLFEDSSLIENTIYEYRARARSVFSESENAIISVKTLQKLPKNTVTIKDLHLNYIVLNWTEVKNCSGYVLERQVLNGDFQTIDIFPSKVLEFKDEALLSATNYTYRIKAIHPEYLDAAYSIISTKTPDIIKNTNLQALNITHNQVSLSWQLPDNLNLNKIVLERRLKDSTYVEVLNTANKVNFYVDKNLKQNTIYQYRLKLYSMNSESDFNELFFKTLQKLNPTALELKGKYFNKLKLAWAKVEKAESYIIERKSKEGEYQFLQKTVNSNLELTDENLEPSSNYNYRIKAKHPDFLDSDFTEISVTSEALLPPVAMKISKVGYNSVQIDYTMSKQFAMSHLILERKNDSTDFQTIATIKDFNLTSFNDYNLDDDKYYTYRIKAYSQFSESIFTEVQTKTNQILANDNNKETFNLKINNNPTINKTIDLTFHTPFSGELILFSQNGVLVGRQSLKNAQKYIQTIDVSAIYTLVLKKGTQTGKFKIVVK
ncbi:MAG: hypothetical protein KA313_02120 [Pseudarcicella sp.]|nr:hypothetical protein [Pseudarcicella sp.]